MFEITDLSKQYGHEPALRNVSLTIKKGMNFILGASGSGKTTLLKIISGMDKDFDGKVFYCGKDIQKLSQQEKGYFYNHVFGFVWQDFHLLEERTVYENIILPTHLGGADVHSAEKILKTLKIDDLADQKVKLLSGGQKQRTAIARELMKNPQVLIADEPTSALDEKSAKTIMEVLRTLSKNKIVIVVTHNTDFVTQGDHVFELDHGELTSEKTMAVPHKSTFIKENLLYNLPVSEAWKNTVTSIKRKPGRFCTAIITLMISCILLLTGTGSAISDTGHTEFEKLLDAYGKNILDISIAGNFMSASGGDEDTPNVDVSQDISGLYETYVNDSRVEFAVFTQPFNNISVSISGQDYAIESSGNIPVLTELLSGRMPQNDGNEVVVPEALVRQSGKTNESIIGETIEFSCSLVNWESGSPVSMPAEISAVIVGVSDNSVSYKFEGQMYTYTVDDSFFFSKPALDALRDQAQLKRNAANFVIRAKTPENLIALKDELNARGIVPIGQFELIEDMVRLQTQTTQLSKAACTVIVFLGIAAVITVALITALLRKKEYAIYKISGFQTTHLLLLNLCDTAVCALSAFVLLFITSPFLSPAAQSLFNIDVLDKRMFASGAGFILLLSLLYYLVSILPCIKIDLSKELKSGEK